MWQAAVFGAQALTSLWGASSSSMIAKHQARVNQLLQDYNNKMVRLSDAQNQNAITTNQIINAVASADEAVQIKRGSILTQAKVETAAAAAGVKGRSVNQAMMSVVRNAAEKEHQRQIMLSNANLAFDQQRRGSAMGAQMNQDVSYIPKPKSASFYLNAIGDIAGTALSLWGPGSGGSQGSGQPAYSPPRAVPSIPNRNIAGTRYLL